MRIDDTTPQAADTPHTVDTDGEAAVRAMTAEAKAANLVRVAELSADTDPVHVAEHVRAMAAIAAARLGVDASATTRDHAAQWQAWAHGVASELA